MPNEKKNALPTFLRESIVKAIRQGGLSIVEDIASSLEAYEIDRLIEGLASVRNRKVEKVTKVEVKPVP